MPTAIPVRTVRNRKIRLKLTDFCNLDCPFCHSEGAAGANDVDVADPVLRAALARLRPHYDQVHLTGGEPTSYRHLGPVVDLLSALDFRIAMTSNGLFNVDRARVALDACAYLNISLHTLSPAYFESFVKGKGAVAVRVLDLIRRNVRELAGVLPVRLNTVISGARDAQQLASVHAFADEHGLPLKLVPDWRTAVASKRFAFDYLARNGFEPSEVVRIRPGSNVRRIFAHADRPPVEVKDIEHFRPDFLCRGCTVVERCVESFSFLRVERSPARFRLCVHQPEVDAEHFFPLFERELLPLLDAAPEPG
ncbi:radical SAM protein [Saccharothrix obliqua]|uniref:radical SAM protein n=1 Tax=Saccharothrix obliqua TaxID=2861747 RepID=UPI001C603BB8|nr:radical SAM protein [Saccharothrix obliqua]MBW4720532.1 radical SAM protein [Saccharothrix obliqua]